MDGSDRILVGLADGVCHVAVCGKATAHHSTALREFVGVALSEGAQEVLIDLSRCQYGDSTFVGTLLQIRKACQRDKSRCLRLVSPTAECEATLRTMGLHRLFTIDSVRSDDSIEWRALAIEEAGRCSRQFCENVAAAHRELAESSEEGRAKYLLIAEAAEAELSEG